MLKKIIVVKFVTLSFLLTEVRAQEWNEDPYLQASKSEELHLKHMYATSAMLFEDISKDAYCTVARPKYSKIPLLQVQAKFYSLMNKLELGQMNAGGGVENFMQDHPTSIFSKYAPFLVGNVFRNRALYEEAIKWYNKGEADAFGVQDRNIFAYDLAYSYFQTHNYEKAKEWFLKIKEDETKQRFNKAHYYLGYIYFKQGEYEEALKEALKAQTEKRQDSGYDESLDVLLAVLYFKTEKYDELFALAQQIKEGHRKSAAKVLAIAGAGYFARQNFNRSVEYYKAYLKTKAALSSEEIYQLGYAYYKLSHYDKATHYLQKLITYDDIYAQYGSLTLGNIALLRDKHKDALASFRKAASSSFNPKITEEALLQVAKLAYELNYSKEAITSVTKFLKDYPSSSKADEAKSLLSEILLTTNNYKQAAEVLKGIKITNLDVALLYQRVFYCYGLDMFTNHHYQEATDLWDEALKVSGSPKLKNTIMFWKGEALFILKDYAKALELYLKVLKAGNLLKGSKIYPNIYYSIAYCYLQTGKYADASNFFERYLASKPKDEGLILNTYVSLGNSYFMLKKYPQAVKCYNHIIRKQREKADYAMLQKAIICGLEGKLDEKTFSLKSLLDLYPRSKYVPKALQELGHSYFLLKEYAKAEGIFKRMIKDYPDNPGLAKAKISLALVCQAKNQPEEAIKIYKEIVAEFPKRTEARQAISAIKNIYIQQGTPDKFFTYAKSLEYVQLEPKTQESITLESARAVFLNKDFKKVVNITTQYLKTYPQGFFAEEALYLRGQAYEQLGQKSNALQDYEEVLKNNAQTPYTWPSRTRAAALLMAEKKYSTAETLLVELVKNPSIVGAKSHKWASIALLKAYEATDDGNKVISYATELLKDARLEREERLAAILSLAKALIKNRKLDEAASQLNQIKAETFSDNEAQAYYLSAYIQFLKGNYEDSERSCFKSIKLFPGNSIWIGKTFLLLAENYYKQKNAFQAIATLQSIVENYKKDDEVRKIAIERLSEISSELKKDNSTSTTLQHEKN